MDTITITHLNGGQTAVAIADLTALADRIRGSLIQPGDTDYGQARRLWNGCLIRALPPSCRVQASLT